MKSPLTYHLEAFDGPLDLLLHLISKNKVSIYDIPIAQILEQYMDELRRMEAMDLEVTSDFVAMAAQLMYIKSKMLLPVYPEEGEEDPRKPLVEALLEYKKCKMASGLLEERMELGRDLYTKPPEVQKREEQPEYHYTAQVLQKAIETILQRQERRSPPPLRLFHGVVGREPVPVAGKLQMIARRLAVQHHLDFESLVLECRSRSEVVALFLAVLELSKAHKLAIVEQEKGYLLTLAGE